QRLDARAESRCRSGVGDVVAVAVDAPDDVAVSRPVFQDNLIAACRLLCPDQCPGAELTDGNGRSVTIQLGSGIAADAGEIIVAAGLNQLGRSEGFDSCSGHDGNTDRTVAVEI